MKPDLLLFIGMAIVVLTGACHDLIQQRRKSHNFLPVKLRRKQDVLPNSRNWRWF
jgi:hypothetical protein